MLTRLLARLLPETVLETLFLRAFGMFKVPMLGYMAPTVTEVSDARCVIRVPLSRRTKNHLSCMYFGALSAGADCAGGLLAMRLIRRHGNRVSLLFKDFEASFLKRAEGDVLFTCEDGHAIGELVMRALESGERQNIPVRVIATVPAKLGDEPVATFTLTLSLKARAR
jgi:acyl-coenzyme A thioesterase PaaI-like protein